MASNSKTWGSMTAKELDQEAANYNHEHLLNCFMAHVGLYACTERKEYQDKAQVVRDIILGRMERGDRQ